MSALRLTIGNDAMLSACLPVGRRSALPVLRSPANLDEGWMREVGTYACHCTD
jgi:hypothetical protein